MAQAHRGEALTRTPPVDRGRLRVLEVVECGGPGGTGNQVSAICSGLDRSLFEVHLAYAVRPGADPVAWGAQAGAEFLHHLPQMTREIRPLRDFSAFFALYSLMLEIRPDLVHAHSSKAGFLARAAAKAAGVPRVLYSPRGYGFLQQDRGRLSRGLYEWLERAVSWIGETVAVGPGEAELAKTRAWAARVGVVRDAYLGRLPPPPAPRGPGGAVTVCALGRMSYPRNPEAFVRLAQRLTGSRNGVRCVWIGGGELEPLAREMSRDMGLSSDKLEITGWLPREEALRRLSSADVLTHFSRWEGLPNAVLDAMACSLPVVASDIPGNRDLVVPGKTGALASSEAALLERVLELIDDPARRLAQGAEGRRAVEKDYSTSRMIDELSRLYLRA